MKKLMLIALMFGLIGCADQSNQKIDVVVSFECNNDVLYVNVKQYLNDELKNEKTDFASVYGEKYTCSN